MEPRLEHSAQKVIQLHRENKGRLDWSGIEQSGWDGLEYRDIRIIKSELLAAGAIVRDSVNDDYWTKLVIEDFTFEKHRAQQRTAAAPAILAEKQLKDYPHTRRNEKIMKWTAIISVALSIATLLIAEVRK